MTQRWYPTGAAPQVIGAPARPWGWSLGISTNSSRRRQWRLSQWRPDRRNQAALWTVTSTARITPSSPASPRAGRHLHRLGPRPSVANDRLRHMLIGYARVSKADGSQLLDLQRDALQAAVSIRLTNIFERAGEIRMTPPAMSILVSSNEVRSHASLKGHTPLTFAGGHMVARAELNNVR